MEVLKSIKLLIDLLESYNKKTIKVTELNLDYDNALDNNQTYHHLRGFGEVYIIGLMGYKKRSLKNNNDFIWVIKYDEDLYNKNEYERNELLKILK